MTKTQIIGWLGYFIVMGCAVASLYALRSWAHQEFSTPDSQERWSKWKDETARQSKGDGPVFRREAKSDEPPTLVLLRDYFGVALTAVILLGTVLYISMFAMVRGAARTNFVPREDSAESRSGLKM